MPTGRAGWFVRKSPADAARDANVPAVFDGTDRYHQTESHCRARCRGSRGTSWDARADARTARALGFVQRHAANDHLSSGVSVAQPIAVGKTQSLGRHDASSGAARQTDQRKAAKLFSVRVGGGSPNRPQTPVRLGPIEVNRLYLDNSRYNDSMRDRAPNPKISDATIARTSLRGTLICRCKAVAPASRKSASVRAPMSPGSAVAIRTRRFRIALAYCNPASICRS